MTKPQDTSVIFIDANAYLYFYQTPSTKKLLGSLLAQKQHVFITQEIVNEVQRNQLDVAQKAFTEQVKNANPPSVASQTNRRKYDGSDRRKPGRPRIDAQVEALIFRMAHENRMWGYDRIQGALQNLGHKVSATSVGDVLRRHGIEPAPERERKTTWKEFLNRHLDQIVAVDFFTIEVWSRTSTLHDSFLHRAFHTTRSAWRHREMSKRAVDGADRQNDHGLRRWGDEGSSLPHS